MTRARGEPPPALERIVVRLLARAKREREEDALALELRDEILERVPRRARRPTAGRRAGGAAAAAARRGGGSRRAPRAAAILLPPRGSVVRRPLERADRATAARATRACSSPAADARRAARRSTARTAAAARCSWQAAATSEPPRSRTSGSSVRTSALVPTPRLADHRDDAADAAHHVVEIVGQPRERLRCDRRSARGRARQRDRAARTRAPSLSAPRARARARGIEQRGRTMLPCSGRRRHAEREREPQRAIRRRRRRRRGARTGGEQALGHRLRHAPPARRAARPARRRESATASVPRRLRRTNRVELAHQRVGARRHRGRAERRPCRRASANRRRTRSRCARALASGGELVEGELTGEVVGGNERADHAAAAGDGSGASGADPTTLGALAPRTASGLGPTRDRPRRN